MEGYVVGFFGVALIVLGVLVLCTSVASLYITTSYFVAFPFGSPVWTGVLFLTLGCFLLIVFKHHHNQPLLKPSKYQVLFTIAVTVVALFQIMIAGLLSLLNQQDTAAALNSCSHEEETNHTCICSEGFIDPPSFVRATLTFEINTEDCSILRKKLPIFTYSLLSLYGIGMFFSVLVICVMCKKLHSIGICRKTGLYLVSADVNPEIQQPSFHSSSVASSNCSGSLAMQRGNATVSCENPMVFRLNSSQCGSTDIPL